jgi:glycosyltransferase involved in cell wall biosynthesis
MARARARGHWAGAGSALLREVDVVHLFGPPHVFTIAALEAAHAVGTSTLYQSVHAVTAAYASIRQGFVGTCNLLDLILTSGPDQAADFAEHFGYEGPTRVVQQWAYGIEAELLAVAPATASPDGTFLVGALSRLDAVKGLDVLVRAVAEAAADHPGLRLRIGGTGEEEGALKDLARSLGVADRVELVGYVTDRVAFYEGVDAFAIASRAEGGPVTGVEAMAAGRPIVSTPVGAMPHRLAGGVGRLVDVDDAAGLARALGGLAAAPEERARLGEAARERYLEASSEASQSALLIDTWTQLAERTRDRRTGR